MHGWRHNSKIVRILGVTGIQDFHFTVFFQFQKYCRILGSDNGEIPNRYFGSHFLILVDLYIDKQFNVRLIINDVRVVSTL